MMVIKQIKRHRITNNIVGGEYIIDKNSPDVSIEEHEWITITITHMNDNSIHYTTKSNINKYKDFNGVVGLEHGYELIETKYWQER